MDRYTSKTENGVNELVLGASRKGLWSIGKRDLDLTYRIRGDAIDKLAKYEDLEEQGMLLMLPIPIGTTVYKIEPSTNNYYIKKTTVTKYAVYDDSIWFYFLNGLGRNIADFGKYVFLTEEEAKQKLKEMEND